MTKGARLDGKGSQRFDSGRRRECVRLQTASSR
jgi:hypothetical protein